MQSREDCAARSKVAPVGPCTNARALRVGVGSNYRAVARYFLSAERSAEALVFMRDLTLPAEKVCALVGGPVGKIDFCLRTI